MVSETKPAKKRRYMRNIVLLSRLAWLVVWIMACAE